MPQIALKNKAILAPRSFFLLIPSDSHPDIEWMKGTIISIPNTKNNVHTYSINWDHETYNGKFALSELRNHRANVAALKEARAKYTSEFPSHPAPVSASNNNSTTSNTRQATYTTRPN
eukprot:CAMPEP_0203674564 /NCGR_PEP_ID=MMETSP0090-20130426/16698_1 /ASSEMBLY_ACC=CAM_ASM_001088 /TAXON_ID=426623 /ORGANISM="Chaetoceros affinis, Strain CCMP159" /LENGTH=117 /DNA_ID=CAMNT_0050540489 /DNA_START=26 /DNA_END=379 /DNA_ORIENTATION=+